MDTQDSARPKGKASKQAEEFLSLRDILDIFLDNWKWFLASVIVFVVLARLYLATQPYVYRRDAVMLVKDDGNRSSRVNFEALSQMGGGLGSGVENEVYILQSHQLLSDVVKDMRLDVFYLCKDGLKTISLYKQKPFEVTFTGEVIPSVFRVRVLSDKECEISKLRTEDFDDDWRQTVAFGQTVDSPAGSFVITPIEENLGDFVGTTVKVLHLNLENATNELAKHITTAAVSEMSTLVAITCTDTDIQRADDILATLLNAYKRSIIVDKNTVAQSTADFIDERIKLIGGELSEVETSLASFKQSNNIVDFSENASAYLQQSNEAEQKTITLKAQREAVQFVFDEVKNSAENGKLLPALTGLGNDELQSLIDSYNDIMVRRNRLAENSGEGGITVKEIDATLKQRRSVLLASMQNYLATLEIKIEQAMRREAELKGSIKSVPQQEREAKDIARQQSIKASLYTYLLNKREETALQLAVTEANVRIVERPYGSSLPIAPRGLLITAVAFLFGLIIPFIIFWVKNLLNMGVRGRKDVETLTTIPIIGEIPHAKDKTVSDVDIIRQQRGGALAEAFRMANFSLGFMHKDAKVIMFTSTIPGEGKTFAARCLAFTMALAGKKVLLIDADIRKGTQTMLILHKLDDGLTSYLAGSIDNPRDMIAHREAEVTFDFIPSGVVPPNPAELLMGERLDKLIAELRGRYDCIILDSVPAQAVADASIMNRVADVTVYVIRTHKIDRRYLPQLERMYQESKFRNLCVLINDAEVENKKYGYGYGYGYGSERVGKHRRRPWYKRLVGKS
ncbi:MAG: polysaccharide biosynthesis tyrosine autokinase [Prevotellaceae bacterium]|nr:polysaccharide biosynthesis tyrosine autokinase [Prevotellaceae bacterium]